MSKIRKAIELFKAGRPILIHDSASREDEVDIVFYAGYVTPETIYLMRTLGGGLICYVTSRKIAEVLGLPYMADILSNIPGLRNLAMKKLRYGDAPAFSIWVNYVGVRTGISDSDRALTISKLHEVVKEVFKGNKETAKEMFLKNFQAPGHVPILVGRSLKVRKGHTELSLALAKLAKLLPSTVIVEMLDKGTSLSVSKAAKIAESLRTVLIEGNELIEALGDLDV